MVRGDARAVVRGETGEARRARSGRVVGPLVGPLVGSVLAIALATLPAPASAHQVGLSRGLYRVLDREHVSVTLTLARGELRFLAREVDQDRDGELSEVEVMVGAPAIEEALIAGLAISLDGQSCAPRFDGATLAEEDGLEIALSYACPRGERAAPEELRIDFPGLVPLGSHRHIARVIPPGSDQVRAERVLHRLRSTAELPLAAPAPAPPTQPTPVASTAAGEPAADEDRASPTDGSRGAPTTAVDRSADTSRPAPAPPRPPAPVDRDLGAYFILGVEHILSGVDHLVFLLGLMIAGGRLRSWALMITAFTLGHSASLALATLEIWSPTPALIEPLIAASIVYVGLENLALSSDPAALRRRWRLTLPFGFIHGFGFAGALSEVGITAGDGALAWVLGLFNLGVELGQLVALATMLLLFRAVPQLQGAAAKRWISAAIALAGLVWLVARVL